jgi:hypothetical protein
MESPTFAPAAVYREPKAAVDWLARAFGFEVTMAIDGPDDDPTMCHYEMAIDGRGRIMIGGEWAEWTRSPASIGGVTTQTTHVQLGGDLDGHCERPLATRQRQSRRLLDCSSSRPMNKPPGGMTNTTQPRLPQRVHDRPDGALDPDLDHLGGQQPPDQDAQPPRHGDREPQGLLAVRGHDRDGVVVFAPVHPGVGPRRLDVISGRPSELSEAQQPPPPRPAIPSSARRTGLVSARQDDWRQADPPGR